ncbi:MAG: amidohydrolase family protein [Deltaproteobacteria bacterium]|jgi:N-acyl-D-amino-acid deacylase|nr:amidohydrolase family protein [Deltaproteobacteria bacterium]
MFDTAINNGFVVDPANNIYSRLSLGLKDGRVAALSATPFDAGAAVEIIAAAGLLVVPGFIDMHMHEDRYDPAANSFDINILDAMLRMGVTSVAGGNCGIGTCLPREYLAAADRQGLPVNIALYAAHAEIRKRYASDNYAPVSSEVIAQMARDLDEQLAGGCLGVSFGLRYVPGTSREELHALARVAARHGKLLAAHARDDAAHIHEAVRELIDVAAEERVRVQVSHIGSMAAYGQMEEILAALDAAVAAGLDLGLDCYPYNAFCTAIGSATYDPGFLERYDIGYEAVEVCGGKYRGQRCTREIFDEVRRDTPEILAVAHVMKEHEVDMALVHPRTILASDGILFNGLGHPRAAGSFPRFLRHYVKERGILGLNEAVAKMTCLPARRLGFIEAGLKKGSLGVGDDADIVLIDFEEIRDLADFAEPLAPPLGIRQVLLGGRTAVKQGKVKDNRLGRGLRV